MERQCTDAAAVGVDYNPGDYFARLFFSLQQETPGKAELAGISFMCVTDGSSGKQHVGGETDHR